MAGLAGIGGTADRLLLLRFVALHVPDLGLHRDADRTGDPKHRLRLGDVDLQRLMRGVQHDRGEPRVHGLYRDSKLCPWSRCMATGTVICRSAMSERSRSTEKRKPRYSRFGS